MVTASIVCHSLDIHALILRQSCGSSIGCGISLVDDIWFKHHDHFNWSISAPSCFELKQSLTTILSSLDIDLHDGFAEWDYECATCQGGMCNIRLDIGECNYGDFNYGDS